MKPSDWSTYTRLFTYVKRYWGLFLIAGVSSALYSAVDAGMIKLLQPLVDDGFVAQDPGFIKMIPIILPLVFLVRGVLSFGSDYSLAWLSRKVVIAVRQELFNHYLKLPATFFDRYSSGELLSKLTFNVEQISKACTDAILDSVRNGFLVPIFARCDGDNQLGINRVVFHQCPGAVFIVCDVQLSIAKIQS